MIKREEQKDPKKRILSVCVKMFIEKGFKKTTMLDIIREADVAAGTFQNIFRTKNGVLSALTEFMFKNQFGIAREMSENVENPAFVYAAETAIQLAITELNENIREIYIEVYTQPKLYEYVYENTSTEISNFFAKYNPGWSESDFYESALGTGGMMRAFMTRKCDKYFTLKRKIERFLTMAFDVYHVSDEDKKAAIARIAAMDIVEASNAVLKKLYAALEMTFDFKFSQEI